MLVSQRLLNQRLDSPLSQDFPPEDMQQIRPALHTSAFFCRLATFCCVRENNMRVFFFHSTIQ